LCIIIATYLSEMPPASGQCPCIRSDYPCLIRVSSVAHSSDFRETGVRPMMPFDSRAISSRRHFLASQGMSIGSLALAWLLHRDGLLAAPVRPLLDRPVYDLKPKSPP